MGPFHDRTDAGKILAKRILSFPQLVHSRAVVLAIPRGGLPVAAPLARELFAPLDILPVRRIVHPDDPEVALGAVSDGDMVLTDIPATRREGLDAQVIERLGSEARARLMGQVEELRHTFPEIPIEGRNVILVDDGIASGATMEAAVRLARKRKAARITVAVPVTSPNGYGKIKPQVNEFLSLVTPHEFYSVGSWYEEFDPVTDSQVREYLGQVFRPRGLRAPEQLNRPSATHPPQGAKVLSLAPEGPSAPPAPAAPTPEEKPVDMLENQASRGAREEIRGLARPLSDPGSLEILAGRLASAKVVMLGESTHGTAEFYTLRRKLTQILLSQHGFNFVAVEGDWPDFQSLNEVIESNEKGEVRQPLRRFERWPTWMWANEEIARLAEWMKGRNHRIYGLDIYSLFGSLHLVKKYAGRLGLEVSSQILNRYACLDPYTRDEISYARSLLKSPEGCQQEVMEALQKILSLRLEQIRLSDAELFDAKQNALIIRNAEEYYRAMIERGSDAWNVRERHMMSTLQSLLQRAGEGAKCIVWAHNAHVGDHRATNMMEERLVSLGGLAREEIGPKAVKLLGFGTYGGSVTAGKSWGESEETMPLPPARRGSWESAMHQVSLHSGINEYWMSFDRLPEQSALRETKGQRSVGVVYRPTFEVTAEHYTPTRLAERYDAFVYVDHSSALPSLHVQPAPHLVPEAWPSGQ